MKKKRAIVSVTNDLYTDQRVDKVCRFLSEKGVDVLLVGRKLESSKELADRIYQTHRMKLFFAKGALFYAEYNFRLFFYLLFQRFDFLVSNDLDTLPACDLAAAFKGKDLVYDSHECFTEVPELIHKPLVRKVWEIFEITIFKNRKRRITVNKSIADYYFKKYKTPFEIVSNFPEKIKIEKNKSKADLGIPENKKILILQGAGINIQRGAEELCVAMQQLDECFLIIIGSGDIFPFLKKMVSEDGLLKQRILIVDKLPYSEMMQYTLNADLGFSLDKPLSLNYQFSLPNKLFDYIRAEIPMIASDLVEVKRVVENYQIGKIITTVTPNEIVHAVRNVLKDTNQYEIYKKNCSSAIEELNWGKQKETLNKVYSGLC